ncbi:hypothetical protein CKW47_21110, partial [Bordetella pertussis]
MVAYKPLLDRALALCPEAARRGGQPGPAHRRRPRPRSSSAPDGGSRAGKVVAYKPLLDRALALCPEAARRG